MENAWKVQKEIAANAQQTLEDPRALLKYAANNHQRYETRSEHAQQRKLEEIAKFDLT